MVRHVAGVIYPLVFLLFFQQISQAQGTEKWDLQRCVTYALEHNISVRQADLQIRFAALDLKQSQMALYPNLNLSGNVGYSSGRNQDPTSFSLITTGYVYNNYTLQASLDIFNWFTKKNTIVVRQLNVQAWEAGLEKAKNDVALNVAVAYLQILLAREQVTLAISKLAETSSELESTRKQVEAGKLPELNAVNLESLVASDSSNLVSAQTSATQYLLQMKALLNIDAGVPFDIVTPPVDFIPIEPLADLQPEAVYMLATQNMPQQKVDELNLKSALKSVDVARGAMFPSFSLFGSLGSAFNNRAKEATGKSLLNIPIGTVNVGTTSYQVFAVSPFESYNYTYQKIPYFSQLDQNLRRSIGLSVSVPIMNGGSLRTAWERSKLNVKQVELTKEQNSFTLKQDIYKAYNDAVSAVQKFSANKKAVDAAQKAYEFAKKRYDLGLLSTYDLITTQNNLQTARSQALYSQYDYVFKMKLLEFYRGQGLKL
jgi:outer membrane protein